MAERTSIDSLASELTTQLVIRASSLPRRPTSGWAS